MKNNVSLEMSIAEFKIIEEALNNYQGRILYLLEKNEDNFEKYQELKEKERKIEELIKQLND